MQQRIASSRFIGMQYINHVIHNKNEIKLSVHLTTPYMVHIYLQWFALYYDEIGHPEFSTSRRNGPIVSSNDCRYVAIDNVDTIAPPNLSDTFSVFSQNIQSVNATFDSLMVYLALLAEHGIHFSAICVQETWLDPHHDLSMFHIPGYKLINRARSCGAHGGLIIYLKDEYTYICI